MDSAGGDLMCNPSRVLANRKNMYDQSVDQLLASIQLELDTQLVETVTSAINEITAHGLRSCQSSRESNAISFRSLLRRSVSGSPVSETKGFNLDES